MNIDFWIQIYDKAIIPAIITAISSILVFVISKLKEIYGNYTEEVSKDNLAMQAVRYVEQCYPLLSSKAKFIKATEALEDLSLDRFKLGNVERRILVEAAVQKMNAPPKKRAININKEVPNG